MARALLGYAVSLSTLKKGCDIFLDFVQQALARFARAPGRMRCEDQVLQLFSCSNDWMIRRWRLLGDHIERRAGDPLSAQRVDERGFIDERAARSVDQKGRRLHQRQSVRIDEISRLGCKRAME